MTSSLLAPTTHGHPSSSPQPAVRLHTALVASSLLMAALGSMWATGRLWFHTPGTELDSLSVLPHLPIPVVAGVPVVLGLTGVVAGARAARPLLTAVAWVQATVFVVVAGDLGVLLTLGYVMALGFPVALVALLVVGARRSGAARLGLLTLLMTTTTVRPVRCPTP